jgi:hypothetical protein
LLQVEGEKSADEAGDQQQDQDSGQFSLHQ